VSEIWCLALVNSTLILLLIFWHFKKKGCRGVTWKKPKTWLLLLLFSFEFICIIRYSSFNLNRTIYIAMIVINNFIESYVFFIICYYYAHKGLSVDSDTKANLMKLMKYMAIATTPCFMILAIW